MLSSSPSGSVRQRIGRYQVLRKIATGGMAELFLAKQVGLDGFEKVVAIKRILAHLAHDREFVQMFQDEARIVAKLHHPNIVQIYDLGKADDTYFIAMEYIPGRNLSSVAKKARAKNEKLPPTHIAQCIAQACEGLYYAHTRHDMSGSPLNIVHRDVSPQNIIVSFSGSVKLVDFGIAKAATKIAHTRAGVLKGKYAYMSPEQIRGEPTDARSDLFAVGIVLYELLCGRRPFEKDNSIQTLKAIVQDDATPCQALNADIPDQLAAIIRRCLRKSPDKRFQSAQEIQLALEDFVSGAPQRINNLVVSEWMTDLFADDLSKEQGAKVSLPGLGDIVLPESDAANGKVAEPTPRRDVAEDGAASNGAVSARSGASRPRVPSPSVPSEVALSRGRGGGSLVAQNPLLPTPNLPPPSERREAIKGEPSDGRSGLIREGVIERPVGRRSDPGEAETVHANAIRPAARPKDASTIVADGASAAAVVKGPATTKDAPVLEALDAPPVVSTTRRAASAGSPSAGPTSNEGRAELREEQSLLDSGGFMAPLGGDKGFDEDGDDPWDEATHGLPGHSASTDAGEDAEASAARSPPARDSTGGLDVSVDQRRDAAISHDDDRQAGPGVGRGRSAPALRRRSTVATHDDTRISPPMIEARADTVARIDPQGELSDPPVDASAADEALVWTSIERSGEGGSSADDDPWGDKTAADEGAHNDDDPTNLDPDEAMDAFDLGSEASIELASDEQADPESAGLPPQDATVDQVMLANLYEEPALNLAVDAASSRGEPDEGGKVQTATGSAGAFSDARTVSYRDEFSFVRGQPSQSPGSHEATRVQAFDPETAESPDEEAFEFGPGFDFATAATVQSLEEAELPQPVANGRPRDNDGATIAVAMPPDFSEDVDIEIPVLDEPEPAPDPPALPRPGLPAPSRSARASSVGPTPPPPPKAAPDVVLRAFSEAHSDELTVGDPDQRLAGPPPASEAPSAPPPFERPLENASAPVHPSPLEAPPGEEDQISYQDEYSALVSAPDPLMPPAYQGAGDIGSTNVPPANLSLSQMLAHPAQAPRERLASVPRAVTVDSGTGQVRPAAFRSASMVGRQIREVVRTAEPRSVPIRTPLPPPASATAPAKLEFPAPFEAPLADPALVTPPSSARRRRWLAPVLAALSIILLAVAGYLAREYIGPSGPQFTIKTTPVGARVRVDDDVRPGVTPITISDLRPGGRYQIRIERTGYETVSREVQLPEDGPLIWQIPLRPEAQPE